MAIERITFEDQREWLRARTKDVTSTECPALPGFDVSPFLSPWELFCRKREGGVPSIEANERMMWGLRLQDAIARGVAEDSGLNIRRMNVYIRDTVRRAGASFDYEIVSHPDGPGVMEIKNVDGNVYRSTWSEEGGVIEAPPHIELQLQHQLAVSGRKWGMIVALVGGNTIKMARREAIPEVGRVIFRKVAEFWEMVEVNHPPPPDFSRDAAAIARLYGKSTPGKVLDMKGNAEMDLLVMGMEMTKASKKSSEEKIEEYKARILEKIGDAEKVYGDTWTISAKEVAPTAGTVVTPEMVGTMINARNGYRGFRVNIIKKEG